ncbi:MAG: hypothetical protein IH595_12185 [Bacteroidales bacterium]|nr:hypothetical protein [Bacteroidales bacterium]
MRIRFLTIPLLLFGLFACNQSTKQSSQQEVKAAINTWKQELLAAKQIGPPCDYTSMASPEAQKWREANPGQLDGLPADDKAIKTVWFDLNNDHKKDLLLYFQGVNCTGHNGGTQTYAKIIYSDSTADSNVMEEIIHAIQAEYNRMKETDPDLKAITSDYMTTTTTITGYHNGITGTFRLYTNEDAHCCPSYSGTYTYRLQTKKMTLRISEEDN